MSQEREILLEMKIDDLEEELAKILVIKNVEIEELKEKVIDLEKENIRLMNFIRCNDLHKK